MNVDAIFIHPIKSCAGIAVDRAYVTPRGLVNDRRWMVVDEAGRFLSQRGVARMALVRLSLGDGNLHVEHEGLEPLLLPLLYGDGPSVDISVWSHRGPAVRHDAGSEWFTRALGRPAQLVCMPDTIVRPVDSVAAQAGDVVSFADGFPLLVTNAASLEDLSRRANFPTDVRRFRPNLVVRGAPAWAEDDWRLLRVGALPIRLPTACARCNVPSIDPDLALPTQEPLRTLATFRKRNHEVYFGMNGIPDAVGELRVGDAVEVIDPPSPGA